MAATACSSASSWRCAHGWTWTPGRWRAAALQLQAALSAAVAELGESARGAELADRLGEVAAIAAAAVTDSPATEARATLESSLRQLEAALRSRRAG